MSKQYLTIHTLDAAHPTDIYSLAATANSILSASGSSTLKIHSTQTPDFPLLQTLPNVHKLGCHHIATSASGTVAASAGFGGEVKVWRHISSTQGGAQSGGDGEGTGQWEEWGQLSAEDKTGTVWAIALDGAGRYISGTSFDGKVRVWDLSLGPAAWSTAVREYETKGSFGLCVAMSQDAKFTASGHENGSIYIFNNDSGRMLHSLPGLVRPTRAVSISPHGTLLAAAGDSATISLFSISSGERVANLSGSKSWIMTLSFNHTGEYILSGSFDGKAKIWSVESRSCVATHGESEGVIWSGVWLPKKSVRGSEMFAVAGKSGGIAVFREATGG